MTQFWPVYYNLILISFTIVYRLESGELWIQLLPLSLCKLRNGVRGRGRRGSATPRVCPRKPQPPPRLSTVSSRGMSSSQDIYTNHSHGKSDWCAGWVQRSRSRVTRDQRSCGFLSSDNFFTFYQVIIHNEQRVIRCVNKQFAWLNRMCHEYCSSANFKSIAYYHKTQTEQRRFLSKWIYSVHV